jgi:hypothetical protein
VIQSLGFGERWVRSKYLLCYPHPYCVLNSPVKLLARGLADDGGAGALELEKAL